MISQIDIQRIEEATDIVDLVSSYIDLKKDGAGFKGCCPFHKEKTPSFKVTPSKQIYKCFGCGKGGDAVSFVMEHDHLSYIEALRLLAKRAGISIEERQRTPEEAAKDAKREAMFVITAKVNQFFVEQLQTNEKAKQYAVKRWGLKYVSETGIGYAPESKVFMEWVASQGFGIDLLKQLHLVGENDKGGLYAQFRQRVTIPQRSRTNIINGWSCRDISERDDTPKYLNSSESEIYQKKELLFGIDIARHEIRAAGKAYVCEGAPDVMRMQIIGVPNTVAPLGGGTLTNEQFTLLSSCYAKTGIRYLCILPDGDTDKADGTNPGKETAIKIGKLATEKGFVVSVKPIPSTVSRENDEGKIKLYERTWKEDPDSYFQTKAIFDETQEDDFIIWLASERFAKSNNTNEIVKEIANLLSMIDDEVRQESLLKLLKSVYKESSVWNKALKVAKQSKKEKEAEEKAFSKDDFQKYGFYELRNSYYSLQGNMETRWSNFTMKPLFHIKDALNPKRIYTIKNESNCTEIIELKQEDLVSLSKFRQRIEGMGNYIFEAGEPQLIKLKRYLYEQTETAIEITQLGWQKQGFYAWGNGIFYQGKFNKADKYGIVRLPDIGNFYLPGASDIYKCDTQLFQFEKKFVHLDYSTVNLQTVANAMIKVFGDNAKVGLCFLVATLFRDIITNCVKAFPMLNLFGPKGSGKSELGHTLMSFFIINNIPANLSNATIAALSEAVAQCSNAIVHLDEFKNNIDLDKREFLKGLWDSAGRTRMNMDRDKKREQTKVDAGVIVSGQEMATADIALFSRFVYLTFNKTEFATDERAAFDELVNLRKMGFSHLTLQILNHRETFRNNFNSMYNETSSDVMNALGEISCESRIINNWVTVAAAYRTIENFLDLPFTYKDILRIVLEKARSQNALTTSSNEIGMFWRQIGRTQQEGKFVLDSDYRIIFKEDVKTDKTNTFFAQPHKLLFINPDSWYQAYTYKAKENGIVTLPDSSIIYYLKNSHEYLGTYGKMRFVNKLPNGQQSTGTTPKRPLCFDYELLEKKYDLSIEIEPEIID